MGDGTDRAVEDRAVVDKPAHRGVGGVRQPRWHARRERGDDVDGFIGQRLQGDSAELGIGLRQG